VPSFQDLGNLVLSRLRQNGVNFGSASANAATDYVPPYLLGLQINLGYQELLSRVKDFPIATVKVSFPTTLNAQSYSLNPIPPGGVTNPAAMRVHEMTYTQAGSYERDVELVSTDEFRRRTGAYVRRYGNYGPLPYFASQLYGFRQLDLYPATATVGDTINLVVTPDPLSSPAGTAAANGGQLVGAADVPLLPAEFHDGIVAYACWKLCLQLLRPEIAKEQQEEFNEYSASILDFASALGAGMAEQTVQDTVADTMLQGMVIP
jgi:hypothetical protein